jgi:signal transduction histidine kinase
MAQRTRGRDTVQARPTPGVLPPQLSETERKLHAQFERLEQQFALLKQQTRQAQKLASLGAAATMLAHEFNNLMTPVLGYARYALDADDKELMAKALQMTIRQTDVITAMSDRILGLAANEAQSRQPVSIAKAVEDAVACMCRDLSKDGITLDADIDASLRVLADPKQLQQVLFNLFINARQAITHRNGRITVRAEGGDEYLEIRIKDNGCGISADNLERIFEEFYTTKGDRPGKSGLGLGLALCREIIEEHRGTITVESEPGHGTTFTLRLPSAD